MSVLRGEHIVCLSSLAWDGRPTSRHHLARELSRENDVLFVDAPTRATRASLRRADFPSDGGRFHVLEPPPHLPVVSETVARATLPLSRRRYERAVVGALATLGWERPILWNCSPLDFSWRLRDVVDPAVDVLHLTDAFWDYPGFGTRQRHHLTVALRRADLVVCTTSEIRDGVVRHATPVRPPVVLGHGVDVDRFASAVVAPPPRGPLVAGFIGRLDRRLDIDLVEAIGRSGMRVVLVGPSILPATETQRLRRAGCELVGEIAYDDLGLWLGKVDVAIVPYRLIASVAASRPLKLLEYLAAGLRVVATPFPAAAELAPDVVTAASVDFAETVGVEAAAERSLDPAARIEARRERVLRVRPWSWAARAEELSRAIVSVC